MAGPMAQYTNEMRNKFGYFAAWTPSHPFKLGDYGILKKSVFRRLANVVDLGISFETRVQNSKANLKYATEGAITETITLAGEAVPVGSVLGKADAGIIVKFGKKDSVLFEVNGYKTNFIANITRLGDDIRNKSGQGPWDRDWLVITELIIADSATILISSSNQGLIELKANAELKPAELNIASLNAQFQSVNSRDLSVQIVAQEGITPLFHLWGIGGFREEFQPTAAAMPGV
jgi:hypothetical protein